MTDWQPIETAPKNGTYFDAWVTNDWVKGSPGWRVADTRWSTFLDTWEVPTGYGRRAIWKGVTLTHWMPLPKPPPKQDCV